jgi:uncharacterized protein YqjF (DUF2071 family)
MVVQGWRDVSFIHWRFDPAELRPHLPADLEPDLIDGSAWVSLTPFRVKMWRTFAETNLRTYVRHRDGSDGLWFLSIDVSSALNALGGRAVAPYFLARMNVTTNGAVHYDSERVVGRHAVHQIGVRPLDPIGPGNLSPLVASLTGRWRAFSALADRTIAVTPVQHQPWPLQFAELTELNESILAAVGLPTPGEAPLVHFSRGVDARLGVPRPIRV